MPIIDAKNVKEQIEKTLEQHKDEYKIEVEVVGARHPDSIHYEIYLRGEKQENVLMLIRWKRGEVNGCSMGRH